MMRVVSRINRVCDPYKEFCQPVLLLDTASAHIAPETLRFARACWLEIVIIPAGMTPLLQVADVFVFASVKQRLSQEFQRMRVTQQQVTVRDWIQRKRCADELFHLFSLHTPGSSSAQLILAGQPKAPILLVIGSCADRRSRSGQPQRHL